jgi:hypothetical protein
MSRSVDQRVAVSGKTLLCMLALAVAGMVLSMTGPPAAAAAPEATDLCVGLQCNLPASGSYVPEAQEAAPAVAGLDELTAREQSGFYELPALVYRGAVHPRAVVYLAKPGDLDRMPASVQRLPAVQDHAWTAEAGSGTDTLVVVDHGIVLVIPADRAAAAARPRARAAALSECDARKFCIYSGEDFIGLYWEIDGPTYTGTGWHNFGANEGSSMANYRDGDSLLADHSLGTGTRYCAQQQSVDSTFDNNAIGNDNASSVALLRGTDDRC